MWARSETGSLPKWTWQASSEPPSEPPPPTQPSPSPPMVLGLSTRRNKAASRSQHCRLVFLISSIDFCFLSELQDIWGGILFIVFRQNKTFGLRYKSKHSGFLIRGPVLRFFPSSSSTSQKFIFSLPPHSDKKEISRTFRGGWSEYGSGGLLLKRNRWSQEVASTCVLQCMRWLTVLGGLEVCVSDGLVCFQPTQGQLGSNRDATMKPSPSAFCFPPFSLHVSRLGVLVSLPFSSPGGWCPVGGGGMGVSRSVLTAESSLFSHSNELKHSTAVLWNDYDLANVLNFSSVHG